MRGVLITRIDLDRVRLADLKYLFAQRAHTHTHTHTHRVYLSYKESYPDYYSMILLICSRIDPPARLRLLLLFCHLMSNRTPSCEHRLYRDAKQLTYALNCPPTPRDLSALFYAESFHAIPRENISRGISRLRSTRDPAIIAS